MGPKGSEAHQVLLQKESESAAPAQQTPCVDAALPAVLE